jgi:hypothetical protein
MASPKKRQHSPEDLNLERDDVYRKGDEVMIVSKNV